MVSRHLELEVPLFEAKSAIDLNETLIDLGLKDAFRELTGQNFEYRARLFYTFNDPKNRFQGINYASLCSLATLFLLGS